MHNKYLNFNDLVLGGAQLGLAYGVNNSTGQPIKDETIQLIRKAVSLGISCIDTASVYGSSEKIIGESISNINDVEVKVITKLHLPNVDTDISPTFDFNTAVDKQIKESLKRLKMSSLYSVLLHRASDLTENGGVIWKRLIELKKIGKIQCLGVSVQTPDELIKSLGYVDVEYIQMPFNILDNRWAVAINHLKDIKKDRDINIHIRSVFLQGLLMSTNPEHWYKANISDMESIISWLNNKVELFERESIADLCVSYVRSLDWVDSVVVGMENIEQLNVNMKLFSLPYLSDSQLKQIEASRPEISDNSLNPAKWRSE